MGTARKIAKKVGKAFSSDTAERIATAVATGGYSETTYKPAQAAGDKAKDLTGITAMEEANDLAKQQYEEQKAAALAEEKAATEEAYLAIEKDRRRRAAMQGRSSTILTGSLGDSGLTTTRKTLLGA